MKVYTKKARKDYPEQGIRKGETYYSWKPKFGGTRRSKTYPRPSQLTSGKMSEALALAEQLEDTWGDMDSLDSAKNMPEALRETANQARDLATQYEESISNMPEQFQESPTAEFCQEKQEALENWADALDSLADDVESLCEEEIGEDCEYADEEALVEEVCSRSGEAELEM